MKQKSGPGKAPAEQVLKDIRRQTRRHYSAEEKIRIVLEGLHDIGCTPFGQADIQGALGIEEWLESVIPDCASAPNFGSDAILVQAHHGAPISRAWSKSSLARPYI